MITPLMRITWPNLFEAKANPSGALKYSCSLLIEKADVAGCKELQAAVDKAIQKGMSTIWNNKMPKFRYKPLRDGDEELAEGDKTTPEYKGVLFLNCSANEAPGVVIATATGPKPLMDERAIFSGCWVRADINPFPYSNSGNHGIGWGLNNILLVKEGPRLDGRTRAEDAFSQFRSEEEPSNEESGDLM